MVQSGGTGTFLNFLDESQEMRNRLAFFSVLQGVGDQVKISGAYCCYVALATAVLHGLGRMGVPVERDKADLGPVVV